MRYVCIYWIGAAIMTWFDTVVYGPDDQSTLQNVLVVHDRLDHHFVVALRAVNGTLTLPLKTGNMFPWISMVHVDVM